MTYHDISSTLDSMILSASGWRGIFAKGGEEDGSSAISAASAAISSCAARVFARFLRRKTGTAEPVVIVGRDTRPTGACIEQAVLEALAEENCTVHRTHYAAAPETMAYARSLGDQGAAGGFLYISASHNPIGHNGLKFGLFDGGVLNADDAAALIAEFRREVEQGVPSAAAAHSPQIDVKSRCRAAYQAFIGSLIAGDGIGAAEMAAALKTALQKRPLGVVCDFNGSARAASIDSDFFPALGIEFAAINSTPGTIVHRIVPEGESLKPCCRLLEEYHQKNNAFMLGYVPDCDGDRGNLVVWDDALNAARPLEAQEVFALVCFSELCHLAWTGRTEKIAVAVNDATSMRVDRIAAAFGARVFRAEVGEANVVSLARRLRSEGWTVRILGEGAAGGTITHPSAVRDPLGTVMSVIKLLTLDGFCSAARPFHLPPLPESRPLPLASVIEALPPFITTGAYTPEALLKIKTTDHGKLKAAYQQVFLAHWEKTKQELAAYGIAIWHAFCYNGMDEYACDDDFGRAGKGGLKINLYGTEGSARAALWMRGSATEPVFRVMADVEGTGKAFERYLITWQRQMVLEADAASAN